MKKSALVFVFAIIIFLGFASALFHNSEANTTNSTVITNATTSPSNVENKEGIDKAYACLENEVDKKSALSLQEAIFTTLALGEEDKALDVIKDEKKSN